MYETWDNNLPGIKHICLGFLPGLVAVDYLVKSPALHVDIIKYTASTRVPENQSRNDISPVSGPQGLMSYVLLLLVILTWLTLWQSQAVFVKCTITNLPASGKNIVTYVCLLVRSVHLYTFPLFCPIFLL